MPTGLPPIGIPGMPGGAADGISGKPVKVTSVRPEGDLRLTAGIGVGVGGALMVTVPAIRHPDDPDRSVSPLMASMSLSASVSGSIGLGCTITGVGSSSRAPVDIAFITDTTGSMSGTVNGIHDSIAKFASEVGSAGIDAQFSMYTYGDAYATTSPKFKVGKGDFAPPSWDSDPRPFVGLTNLGTFQEFLREMKTSGSLGVGGGDLPENSMGAMNYAFRRLAWRPGAGRAFILISDTSAHQAGDGSTFITPPWTPPRGDEVVNTLNGLAVVHVVGRDEKGTKFYNLKNASDATGGTFKNLPSDGKVDLGTLGFRDWFANSFRGMCSGLADGSLTVVVRATVVGKRVYTGSLTFQITVGAGVSGG